MHSGNMQRENVLMQIWLSFRERLSETEIPTAKFALKRMTKRMFENEKVYW